MGSLSLEFSGSVSHDRQATSRVSCSQGFDEDTYLLMMPEDCQKKGLLHEFYSTYRLRSGILTSIAGLGDGGTGDLDDYRRSRDAELEDSRICTKAQE